MSEYKVMAMHQPSEIPGEVPQGVKIMKTSHLPGDDLCTAGRRSQRSFPFSRRWAIHRFMGLLGMVGLMLLALGCSGDSSSSSDHEIEVLLAINSLRVELQNNFGQPVPALSVLAQTPTETVFASAANTQEEAITPDTYFRIASITKTFTATAILLMQQNGWLDISHTITTTMPAGNDPYIPDTSDYDIPYKKEITIEQLLQHTAGVYDVASDPVPGCGGTDYVEWMLEQQPDYQFTAAELVRQDAIYQLSYFAPGTDYHYSNTGYTLLSEIISRVYSFHAKAPKTYSDFVMEHVVGPATPYPLAMAFPYLGTDQTMPSPSFCGKEITADGDKIYCRDNLSGYVAEGNGLATMEQLNTFVRTLMRGENVLGPESVALMQNDASSFNPDYGLGCHKYQYLGYGHAGDIRGYHAIMAYNPETQVSIVTLLPLWDTRSLDNFKACQITLYEAAYATLKILGYPAGTFN